MTNYNANTETQADDILAAQPTEFYKYAYTELLHRYVIASCDKVIESGEVLQRNIESLLKDTQELVYNCTSAEVEGVESMIREPVQHVETCAKHLADALQALQEYKATLLSSDKP